MACQHPLSACACVRMRKKERRTKEGVWSRNKIPGRDVYIERAAVTFSDPYSYFYHALSLLIYFIVVCD